MIEIKVGHTNVKKYRDGNKMIIYKNHNGFNHVIDYACLQEFDFVPKLLENTNEKVVWEYIEGKMLKHPSDEDLKVIGTYLRQLHKSDVIFPKNNFRARYREYLKVAHAKGIKMSEVENNWGQMNKLVTRMSRLNPCHNDLWWQNIIKDKNGKIWIVDWEYATMGDKHFDLAFFIDSLELTPRQEKIFLETYNSFDKYWAYIPEWMAIYKKFVNWFTLTWANAQEKLPFDLSTIKENVQKF